MLRVSLQLRSYQRGGWKPGSKHQKHQMMNPTLFLYRFPGPRGAGPYTMKYWWTLGCFPTGREVPFRLSEFLQTYYQMHVPVEVEEWLDYFVKHPASDVVPALGDLLKQMESLSDGLEGDAALDDAETEERGYQVHAPSVMPLLVPARRLEACLSVRLPASGLRGVMTAQAPLRKRAMDACFEYREAVQRIGSTPHRRAGFAHLALSEEAGRTDHRDGALLEGARAQLSAPRHGLPADSKEPIAPPPAASVGSLVGLAATVPETTAEDEKCLIRLGSALAEGSMRQKKFRDAADTLSSLLLFCHDDDTRGTVHSSLASALNRDGRFREAAFHGREAALLKSCPRGYANWAVATAYMDDFERAEHILEDGIVACASDALAGDTKGNGTHPSLTSAQQSILAAKAQQGNRRVRPEMRHRRAHLPSQQQRGLEEGEGRMFDNPFDQVVFNKQKYTAKMDPTNFELGSVFRRVGDVGGFISSTKSMEKI